MGTQVRTINAYIARDFDGSLFHYSEKPLRDENNDQWATPNSEVVYGELPKKMFPEITWEDEPRKVEIAIKLL